MSIVENFWLKKGVFLSDSKRESTFEDCTLKSLESTLLIPGWNLSPGIPNWNWS